MRYDGEGCKRILRGVLARYVPPALAERPKQGFSVPIADWLRGPLQGWAEDYLAEGRVRRQGLFEPAQVRRLWDQHRSGWRKHPKAPWAVLVFPMWAGAYLYCAKDSPPYLGDGETGGSGRRRVSRIVGDTALPSRTGGTGWRGSLPWRSGL